MQIIIANANMINELNHQSYEERLQRDMNKIKAELNIDDQNNQKKVKDFYIKSDNNEYEAEFSESFTSNYGPQELLPKVINYNCWLFSYSDRQILDNNVSIIETIYNNFMFMKHQYMSILSNLEEIFYSYNILNNNIQQYITCQNAHCNKCDTYKARAISYQKDANKALKEINDRCNRYNIYINNSVSVKSNFNTNLCNKFNDVFNTGDVEYLLNNAIQAITIYINFINLKNESIKTSNDKNTLESAIQYYVKEVNKMYNKKAPDSNNESILHRCSLIMGRLKYNTDRVDNALKKTIMRDELSDHDYIRGELPDHDY